MFLLFFFYHFYFHFISIFKLLEEKVFFLDQTIILYFLFRYLSFSLFTLLHLLLKNKNYVYAQSLPFKKRPINSFNFFLAYFLIQFYFSKYFSHTPATNLRVFFFLVLFYFIIILLSLSLLINFSITFLFFFSFIHSFIHFDYTEKHFCIRSCNNFKLPYFLSPLLLMHKATFNTFSKYYKQYIF